LLLTPDERNELVMALLETMPVGLQVIYSFHELREEVCEDYHFVISGYDVASGDRALRLYPGHPPHDQVTRQLNEVIKRIEARRTGGTQPSYGVAQWHLNRKRKPKSLLQQVKKAADGAPEMPVFEVLENLLHYPVVVTSGQVHQVITWDRVKPMPLRKSWQSQLASKMPVGENILSTEIAEIKRIGDL
jgi:hypothetical protein